MKNIDRLADRRSDWKTWYFIFGPLALMLGSQASLLTQFAAGLTESKPIKEVFEIAATPFQFVSFSALALLFIRIFSRKWPIVEDLGLTRNIKLKDLVLILLVFAATHVFFKLLFLGAEEPGQAERMFGEFGFKNGHAYGISMVVSSVILAPVCEELLYRGVILRAIHDGLVGKTPLAAAAVSALLVSSIFFAMPHLGESLFGRMSLAYIVSGLAFGFVYVKTGSLTAAMVSHSLQSCFAFGAVLLYGRGDAVVSPVVYILVFGCPLWTYLCAKLLWAILPKAHRP